MTMIFDDFVGKKREMPKPKRREIKPFQTAFKTSSIPLDPVLVKPLSAEAEFMYPPQVIATCAMFPTPLPKTVFADKDGTAMVEGKIIEDAGAFVKLKQSKNMLVCFPTSSGKTFLIKLFLLKHIKEYLIEHVKKGLCIYTAPLKALAEEKYAEFTKQFPSLNIGISTGDYHFTSKNLLDHDILIVTIDKLDSMIRNNQEAIQKRVACVVIDEIHTMGFDNKTAVENVIKRLKAMKSVPILATSATVGNARKIASWLDADYFESSFRPVPLKMGVLVDDEIEYQDHTVERFQVTKTNNVEKIIAKLLLDGHQIMYVRMTRSNASSFAKKMVPALGNAFHDPAMELPLKGMKKDRADEEIELARCVSHGVAWHHAGLDPEAKDFIEQQFKAGKIRFICSTTTLAAGINMPAEWIFIDWKRFGDEGSAPIRIMEAHQIAGRAGRPQYDDMGYAIFVCKKNEDYEYCMDHYLSKSPEPISSPVFKDKASLFHSIIGDLDKKVPVSLTDIHSLYKNTFAYFQKPKETMAMIDETMYLFAGMKEPMIKPTLDKKFVLTEAGALVKQYYVNPVDADKIMTTIKKSPGMTHLGIVHLIASGSAVIPLVAKGNQDYWMKIYEHASKQLSSKIDINDDREWKSFQMACVLVGTGYHDKEVGREIVYADEDVTLQQLFYTHGILSGDLNRSVGYSGNFSWLLAFAARAAVMFGKTKTKVAIDDVITRLKYGVSQKLVPLCSLEGIGRERAKALFKTGYCDVESIARAPPSDLADVDINGAKLGFKIATSAVDSARALLARVR
jgi:helicase